MNTKLSKPRLWRLSAIALAASASLVVAQSTSLTEEEDVIVLTPFEVSADDNVGYQPTSTTSLTGVRQELKDLPFSVEVFGEDMIADIGATELNEIVEFATNANGTQGDENLQRESNFRGITTRFSRRNQYIWYNPSDSFSIGRVEIIRGPSSLLYGQGEPGGLINFQTKQAVIGRNTYTGAVRVGSDSNLRGTFDANIALGDRAALLIAGVADEGDNWKENVTKEVMGYYLNLRVKLTEKTTFKAEYEDVVRDDTSPTGVLRYNGQQFNRTPELLNNPAVADGLITKENSQSWAGADLFRQRTWSNYAFGLDHQFNEHVAIDLGYNVQDQGTNQDQAVGMSQLLAPNLTNAATNDDDWRVTVRRRDGDSLNTVETARARLLLNFDVAESSHQVVIGGVHRTDAFELRQFQERVNNGNAAGGGLRPNEIFYIKDGPGFSFPASPTNPAGNANHLGYVLKEDTGFFPIQNEETLKAGYAVWMGEFLEERLRTVVGVRRDDLEKINLRNGSVQFATEQTSYNSGVNFAFSEKISGYFNYAESFKAPGAFRVDPLNNTLPPAIGSGLEFGLKFDLFDDRVSGLLTYFDAQLEGDDFNLGGNTSSRNAIDPNGLNGRNGGNRVPVDTTTDGFEIQFVANPTENLTVSFGYGFNNARTAEDVVYQSFFNDGFLADGAGNPVDENGNPLMVGGNVVTLADITLNASGNITNANALGLVGNEVTGATTNQVTGQTTSLVTIVAGGEKVASRPEQNINLLARYDFRDGGMKGFFLGGNARLRWDYISGYTGNVLAGTRQLVKGDNFVVLGANIGYRKKMERFTWTSQLVVNNILDEDYYEGTFGGGERWGSARNIVWTNSFRF